MQTHFEYFTYRFANKAAVEMKKKTTSNEFSNKMADLNNGAHLICWSRHWHQGPIVHPLVSGILSHRQQCRICTRLLYSKCTPRAFTGVFTGFHIDLLVGASFLLNFALFIHFLLLANGFAVWEANFACNRQDCGFRYKLVETKIMGLFFFILEKVVFGCWADCVCVWSWELLLWGFAGFYLAGCVLCICVYLWEIFVWWWRFCLDVNYIFK